MVDARKGAIVAVTTTTIGAWDASNFADALLKHEKLLMPQGGPSMSVLEQVTKLKNNAPHLQRIASAWENNNGVLDGFANALNRNPEMLKKFREIAVRDGADGQMNTTTGIFSRYSQGGAQELQKAINVQHRQYYPNQYQANPAPAAKSAPADDPSPSRDKTPATPKRTADTEPAARRTAPGSETKVAPPVAATPAGAAPDTQPAAVAARPEKITQFDGDTANIVFQSAIGTASTIFGTEFKQQEDDLTKRLNEDPALRNKLADAINRDPELLKQLSSKDGGAGGFDQLAEGFDKRSPEQQEAIRNAFREPYKQLLQDPTLIGDSSFRTDIAKSAIGAVPITTAMVGREGGLVDQIGEKLHKMYPDLENEINTFKNQIKGDPKLQQQIADNLNNNPEFVAQMMSFDGEDSSGFMGSIKKMFGKSTIQDLLANPAKLANDSYVDSLSSKLSGEGGFMGSIMKFVQGLLDMIAPMFQKGAAALSMGNGRDLLGDLGGWAKDNLGLDFGTADNVTKVDHANGQIVDPNSPKPRTDDPQRPLQAPAQNAQMADVGKTIQNLQHQAPATGPSGGGVVGI
ncbi:MAG: hypothetical protein DI586_00085 [Micavibrio aeruginosavorus]|uniref:Uncharacterized protein n=1 Tax=Micavibrio aeruginosavorus TaxID=349221 RepID=A0A2W5FR33_9BACT|nr:MAG: hypothetical protein DI586_00085 [Micavibrio aeruginosavorus]